MYFCGLFSLRTNLRSLPKLFFVIQKTSSSLVTPAFGDCQAFPRESDTRSGCPSFDVIKAGPTNSLFDRF